MTEALIGFALLLGLIFLRIPIAFAMAAVGALGYGYIMENDVAALAMLASVVEHLAHQYTLSVVPLFILMGNFVTRAGLSNELYAAANAFLGHRRGGLAMSTVVACGGFSAVCGSSLATAATMAKVSMPSMRKFGYSEGLAAGSIAAGGTLGILIPPSVILIIYGIQTQTDIGALFLAGVIPGLLGVLGYLGAVLVVTHLKPELGPPGDKTDLAGRIQALKGVWGVLLLFMLVMGGIYAGWFTPTEAAGIGAVGAFFFALLKRTLTVKITYEILVDSARTTAMIFTVLIGADAFSNFINLTGLPDILVDSVMSWGVETWVVILFILVVYMILGCVLESLSMILLTVPVFYPLVQSLGLDLIWFGIIVVVVTEISLITPPVGLNVFVLKGVLPHLSTKEIFKGVTPFWVADIIRLILLVSIPALSIYLPTAMLN